MMPVQIVVRSGARSAKERAYGAKREAWQSQTASELLRKQQAPCRVYVPLLYGSCHALRLLRSRLCQSCKVDAVAALDTL